MSDPLNHLGSVWYHSEPSDIPLFSKPVSWFGLFCRFLQPDGSKILYFVANNWTAIGRKNMYARPKNNNSKKWKLSSSCHSFLNSLFSEFTNVQLISNTLNAGYLYLISKKTKQNKSIFCLFVRSWNRDIMPWTVQKS